MFKPLNILDEINDEIGCFKYTEKAGRVWVHVDQNKFTWKYDDSNSKPDIDPFLFKIFLRLYISNSNETGKNNLKRSKYSFDRQKNEFKF
jgi:hypothetical protein